MSSAKSADVAKRVIAVFSSSSATGTSCVRELLSKCSSAPNNSSNSRSTRTIRALFRSKDKAALLESQFSKQIESGELQIVSGYDGYDSESKLALAFEGADVAVLVTPHDLSRGFTDDAMLSMNMIRAANNAGVKHIVNVGSWTVNEPEQLSMIANRFISPEETLKQLQASWTSLRAGFFNANLVQMFGPQLKAGNVIKFPIVAFAPVNTVDIGKVAAAIASVGGVGHESKTYEITGPQIHSTSEMVEIFSRALDRNITHEEVSASVFGGEAFPPPLRQLLTYLESRGKTAAPHSKDVENITEMPASTLEEWIRDNKNVF
jgi:uncharacterized protein YbjT (DUF2867 family)